MDVGRLFFIPGTHWKWCIMRCVLMSDITII
jgi:hypothetical protein